MVMPVAYQPPFNGPTALYQSPVVYSAEQFPNQPPINQVAPYPVGYPMGYATYPVNGEIILNGNVSGFLKLLLGFHSAGQF